MRRDDLRRLDSEFEAFLDQALADCDETELTPEKREARRAVCDRDPHAFGKEYFGHIFDAPYNSLHDAIRAALVVAGMWFVSGFRRCGKSAYAYICVAIHRIVLGKTLGPALVGIANRDRDLATKRTSKLFRLITRNRKLCYDYDIEVEQEQAGWYIINGVDLVAISQNVGLRGYDDENFKRFAVLIADDLYNRQTVGSEADNKRVVDFIESEIRGGLEPGGVAIVLGNSITEDCPMETWKQKHPRRHVSLPALDEDGESTWAAKVTTAEWIAFRDGDDENDPCPDEVWHGDYMDQPLVVGDVFDPDWIRTVNLALIEIIASVSSLDPAHGVSPAACLKGLTTTGYTSSDERVLLDVYGRQESYRDLFDYVASLRDAHPEWRWQCLLFENDFEQWNIAMPYYDAWCKLRGAVLAIVTHYSSQLKTDIHGASKASRIMNLVHPRQYGRYRNAADLEERCGADYRRWLAQYKAFGATKAKVDIIDAEATGYLKVVEYVVQAGGIIQTATPREERLFGKGGFDSFSFR